MTEYLIKSFPERARPAAKIVDGPVQASIKLWDVPTPGSRPHDPLAAKDGAIWYTGQMTNKLGRVDPKTGTVKEYPLKTPHTGPHGLVEDKDGNVWFTGNHAGLIGKLDPKTGNVTEYKMPDPTAKDPHTLAIDHQSGIVWFTLQQANMIGRLDPKTGEIKLVTAPTPKSRPYGLLINSKGVPVYCAFGTNKLATVDPKTMAIKEYALPNAGVAAAPHRAYRRRRDLVRGLFARLSRPVRSRRPARPRSGRRRAGRSRQPYGIVFTKGALWYNESVRQAEHDRALRSQDREIPDLGDSGRRRHRAQHGCHPRRQPGDGQQPHQPGRAGRGEVGFG